MDLGVGKIRWGEEVGGVQGRVKKESNNGELFEYLSQAACSRIPVSVFLKERVIYPFLRKGQ